MKAQLKQFGELEIEGQRFDHDVVIDGGRIRKRKKGPSKPFREAYGHTPLSAGEAIPWGGKQLIIGTGAYGRLPIMEEIYQEAGQRGITISAVPTEEACKLIEPLAAKDIHAILHCTC